MNVYGRISGSLTSAATLSGSLASAARLTGGLTIPAERPAVIYDGPTEFTPAQEAQTIEIAGMWAAADITINPIPSNYGLITWNGATLLVS
ncbi:hypothetical protein [Ruminococcus sp.]|uniref:hypothetical protein n=1 Tax=Ruminococcus sp. TaxID=41978 RepID=UPI00386C646B